MTRALRASALVLLMLTVGVSQTGRAAPSDVTLHVGYLPIAECAHLYVGIAKRFFAEEHLDVQLQPMKGGSAILPAVQSGDLDVGFTNVPSMIILDSHLQPNDDHYIVSLIGASYERAANLNHALLVAKSSPLKPRDLGREDIRFALNTTLNIEDLMLRRFLAKNNIPPHALNIQQIPFPEMPQALRRGDVDVISVVEPFIAPVVKRGDARLLARQYIEVSPETLVATYAVSRGWLAKHRDIATRFSRAMTKADAFIQANPGETRNIVGSFTRIQKEDLPIIGMPAFGLAVDIPRLQELIDEMAKYQFITQRPAARSMVSERLIK
jgi:NitT/TauT family transport system substrate-binding protein